MLPDPCPTFWALGLIRRGGLARPGARSDGQRDLGGRVTVSTAEQLRVRVNDELVLDAGTCEEVADGRGLLIRCACGSSGGAVCGAGGVMAWERGRREGARGRGGR
jgi:hypothetical protein